MVDTVLQVVDESGTVLFDFNDPTGANSGAYGSVKTQIGGDPNWGSPQQDALRFSSPSFDGGSTAYRRAMLTPASIKFRMYHSSQTYDNLVAGLRYLSRLLAAGCVMKWVPPGATDTLYYDIEPTDTPAIFDGRALGLLQGARQADTPEQITLSLLRQPYPRGPELDPTVNVLDNATLMRDTAQDNRPDSWSWSSASNISNEAIVDDGLDSAFQFDIATAASRQLLQVSGTSTVATGETWVMSGYARVTSSAYTNCEVQAMIEFQQSGGTAVNTATGTLLALTTQWQRVSVSGVAGAAVSKAQFGLRMDNTSATAATVQFQRFQGEEAAAATKFRVGVETPSNDPTVAPGRVVMFWAEGDAPTPVRCYFAGSSSYKVITAVRNEGAIAGWANYAFKQAESMTLGTDTTAVAVGATASGSSNDVARTTFATNTIAPNRLTWLLSAAELAGVQGGAWQVWGRCKVITTGDIFTLELAHTFEASSTVETLHPQVDFGLALGNTDWHDVLLGTINVPSDASALEIRLGGIRSTGSGNLDTDFLHLVPAAQAGYHGATAFALLETDPQIPRVAAVTAAHLVTQVGTATGPVPFIAQPGPNAVYVTRTTFTTGSGDFDNHTLAAYDASFYYSPRYHL